MAIRIRRRAFISVLLGGVAVGGVGAAARKSPSHCFHDYRSPVTEMTETSSNRFVRMLGE
jgi:hypothetical protein